MTEEEKKALAAYRAMRAGGAKGGKATGDAKRRDPEHYANATLKAAIARARAKGLHLYLVAHCDGERRVQAADDTAAKKRAVELDKSFEGKKLTTKRLS
jgi:hypothetical protein